MVKGLKKKIPEITIQCNECKYGAQNNCPCQTISKYIDVLRVIYKSPFIIENLHQLGKLGKKAEHRYIWGTITNKDVATVEEFFKDEEQKRNKSK